MKRDELKNLIKECLVEILSEGISVNKPMPKRPPVNYQPKPIQQTPVRPHVEKKQVKTGNVMSAIFEDTMRNTLPKMAKAESRHFLDESNFKQEYLSENLKLEKNTSITNKEMTAEELVDVSMPEDLFGEETSEKWAKIAFNDLK
jgi:hypothetical protein